MSEVWIVVRQLDICDDDGEYPGLSFDFRHASVFASEAEAVAYMSAKELPVDWYAHRFVAGERTATVTPEAMAAQAEMEPPERGR